MFKLKALDKKTGKIQKVVFIDWDTTFIKLKDGTLVDFKNAIVYLDKSYKEVIEVI